jgi:hypothetical protein
LKLHFALNMQGVGGDVRCSGYDYIRFPVYPCMIVVDIPEYQLMQGFHLPLGKRFILFHEVFDKINGISVIYVQ